MALINVFQRFCSLTERTSRSHELLYFQLTENLLYYSDGPDPAYLLPRVFEDDSQHLSPSCMIVPIAEHVYDYKIDQTYHSLMRGSIFASEK